MDGTAAVRQRFRYMLTYHQRSHVQSQRPVRGVKIHVYDINPHSRQDSMRSAIAKILRESLFQSTQIKFDFRLCAREGVASRSLRGILTLPSAAIGSAFLSLYGGPAPRAEVIIKGRLLHFYRDASDASHQTAVRPISTHFADPQSGNAYRQPRLPGQQEAFVVPIHTVQLGWECRDGAYSVEYEIPSPHSTLRFDSSRREFCVRTTSMGQTRLVLIRASQVIWAAFGQGGTTDATIFFSLSYPPTYETVVSSNRPRKRDMALDGQHAHYAPFIATSLRLLCASGQLSAIRRLLQAAKIQYKPHTHPVVRRNLFAVPLQQAVISRLEQFPFEVAFQLERMARDITMDLRELLAFCPCVDQLLDSSDAGHVVDLLRHLDVQLKATPEQELVSTYLRCLDTFVPPTMAFSSSQNDKFECYHVVVTPSTVILDGPFPERKNRVLRQYPDHTSHFLRVIFSEEGGRLQYRLDRDVDGETFIKHRVGSILNNGLTVAGRHFHFLAYSQSGLKSHSVWLMRPFDIAGPRGVQTVTATSIIKDLGSFTGLEHDPMLVYCPARYAARISQAFTSTEAAVTMDAEEVFPIRDMLDSSGKRSFTDGVGTISPDLADEIWTELQLVSRRYAGSRQPAPRAFQIRFMGSKGMLSVDHTLTGRTICIRPSMEKFLSEHRQIEVAMVVNKPGEFCLNRPLIMLLENLGAAGGYEYFKRLQDRVINETKEATQSLDSAARVLERHGLGTGYRLASVFLNLHKLGLDVLGDPFVHKTLQYAVHHILRELKHHARIPVPGGYTLVGVADIHGFLKENEVFACVVPAGATSPIYLEGPMMIARSPVCHPGDVQVVKAIGPPPPGSPFTIEPLTNTVVFSVQGEVVFRKRRAAVRLTLTCLVGTRPLASKLAGGDLDGTPFVQILHVIVA